MMRSSNNLPAVYVYIEPIDFRLQINGLSACVQATSMHGQLLEQLFVFTNRRRNRVKVLDWERNGVEPWHKRLARDRFHRPRGGGPMVTLTGQELDWLLDGFALSKWRPHARLQYAYVA